jgi:hypothetical protein
MSRKNRRFGKRSAACYHCKRHDVSDLFYFSQRFLERQSRYLPDIGKGQGETDMKTWLDAAPEAKLLPLPPLTLCFGKKCVDRLDNGNRLSRYESARSPGSHRGRDSLSICREESI